METETLQHQEQQPAHPEMPVPEVLPPQFQIQPEKSGISGWFKSFKEKHFSSMGPDALGAASGEFETPAMQAIDAQADALTESMIHKVENQLGSNEGGWYEKQATGERFYLKFYENPDQAKVEFIANSIYARLGIKAVHSELLEVDGRQAVASAEIPEPEATYKDEQRASKEIRDGFVADAYLANWDVVGLSYDNIVKGKDGMYRVDNGGSLTFRAQGGPKEYASNNIPELTSMLNPDFPAGQVFEGLSQEELKAQAQSLVSKLDEKAIDQIMAESELSGEAAKVIREGLIGRRKFLMEHFGITTEAPAPSSRLKWVFDQFEASKTKFEKLGVRAKESLISDGNHLENQEISLIDFQDQGFVRAQFKLTERQYKNVLEKMTKMLLNNQATDGNIFYSGTGEDWDFDAGPAFSLQHNGMNVLIARRPDFEDETKRAMLGLVQVNIPYGQEGNALDIEQLASGVNDVLVNVLEVPEGLQRPDEEAEFQYKAERYRWHHRTEDGPPSLAEIEEIKALKRKEVFPGYHTMVSEGKHLQYEEAYGEFAAYHSVFSIDSLASILQNGGLMSSHERYSRGLILSGTSTKADFTTGGADSVFTRTIAERARLDAFDERPGQITLVFKPEIYDRTDWYAYEDDQYGATDSRFKERKSPEELLASQLEAYRSTNEQMFRTGIALEDIAAIAVTTNNLVKNSFANAFNMNPDEIAELWAQGPKAVLELAEKKKIEAVDYENVERFLRRDARMAVLKKLDEAGITEINGVPVEQLIVQVDTTKDYIDIAHGRPPRSSAPKTFNAAQPVYDVDPYNGTD
jgi:hypothetical protein